MQCLGQALVRGLCHIISPSGSIVRPVPKSGRPGPATSFLLAPSLLAPPPRHSGDRDLTRYLRGRG